MNALQWLQRSKLFAVILTITLLTTLLLAMVWGRVSLLENGAKIVLKTAPVDPRSFFRGYYVRLNYDISRLKMHKLPGWTRDNLASLKKQSYTKRKKLYAFKRHQSVYVELKEQDDGFWSPQWVHRTQPGKNSGSVYIKGRVRYYSCKKLDFVLGSCTLNIRYGIEKFFAQKKRTKKLEDFARQQSPEMIALNKQVRKLNDERRQTSKEFRARIRNTGRREMILELKKDPKMKEINTKLRALYKKQKKLRQRNNKARAKRFAVIVRVNKKTGEAGISGLQLDGRQIYEESLF